MTDIRHCFFASLKGHVDAARLLLDAGAAVDKEDELRGIGRRLGLRACWKRRRGDAIGGARVLTPPQSTRALAERRRFCLLAENGISTQCVYVEKGADVELANKEGTTPPAKTVTPRRLLLEQRRGG